MFYGSNAPVTPQVPPPKTYNGPPYFVEPISTPGKPEDPRLQRATPATRVASTAPAATPQPVAAQPVYRPRATSQPVYRPAATQSRTEPLVAKPPAKSKEQLHAEDVAAWYKAVEIYGGSAIKADLAFPGLRERVFNLN